jgi:hypothetical protein
MCNNWISLPLAFAKAKICLNEAPQHMIKDASGTPNAFVYKVSDLVKVSPGDLEPHGPARRVQKLQFIQPWTI